MTTIVARIENYKNGHLFLILPVLSGLPQVWRDFLSLVVSTRRDVNAAYTQPDF